MALKLQFHNTCSKNALSFFIIFFSMCGIFCARPKRCDSKDCKDLSESIAASINWNVHPCADFYEHACGNWVKTKTIPRDDEHWDTTRVITNKVQQQLHDMLDAVQIKDKKSLESKAKIAYDACVNKDQIENTDVQFMLAVIQDIGPWPMIMPPRGRNAVQYSWQKLHAIYGGMLGDGPLININIMEDQFKNGKPVLYLDQPTGVFKVWNIINTGQEEEDYKFFVRTVVELFSKERNKAIPAKRILQNDIDTLVNFRIRLKEIMSWGFERKDVHRMYNPTTIKELQRATNEISKRDKSVTVDWKELIETTVESSRYIDIKEEQEIIICEWEYIVDLLALLAETDEETIANHMHLFFIESNLKYADRKTKVIVSIPGESENIYYEDRWIMCLATHPMKHVLSTMYVEKYFSEATKEEVLQLLANLRSTAIEQIKESPWLSKNVKEKAIKKMEYTKFIVGYPDWYKNPELMANYYQDQQVSDVYLFNMLNYKRMAYRRRIERLSPRSFNEEMRAYPLEVDVGYSTFKNTLEIPAATMQLPLFSENVPDVFLYAMGGHILGHELAHAFDRLGKKFDEHGHKTNWWDKSSLDKYKERMQCIIDKYSTFPIKGLERRYPYLRSNGAVTADEDFADILGLILAYKSFEKIQREEGSKETRAIPGLNGLSQDKIFFYAYAQMQCEFITDSALFYFIKFSKHSVNNLRVNGPLSNMPEFRTAFHCRPESFMHAEKQCYIWEK